MTIIFSKSKHLYVSAFITVKMSTPKRRDLTFSEKLELLKSYDKLLTGMSQRNAANVLNISQPLLSKLLKQRKDIESAALHNENQKRKRRRAGKEEDVERALKEWFLKVRPRKVNGPLLRQKAEEIAKHMGKTDFKATEGWFNRWKKRENICLTKLDQERSEDQTKFKELLAEYSPDDVFNAVETGLDFRALPEDSFVKKTSKHHFTLLCCASMVGEKKQLLVVAKNKRCLKEVKKLPVDYEANTNCCLTSQIFNNWLVAWDKTLTRNILLVVDIRPSYNITNNFKHIKVVFLPTHTPSLIQGLIPTLKALYRILMRTRVMIEFESNTDSLEVRKISLLEALHLVNNAWSNLTEQTIRNCFRRSGFVQTKIEEEVVIEKPSDLDDKTYEKWMDFENDGDITEQSICAQILHEDIKQEDDEEEEAIVIPPSNKEMLDALEVLRRGVQSRGEHFQLQYEYERFIFDVIKKLKN